jgi:protein-S-isoprenylcysteine O-methyltransferase Ste14
MQAVNPTSANQPSVISGIFLRAGQILFMFIFLGLVLFLGSGTIHWPAAWVFLGISLVSVAINAVFMLLTSPETVAERGRAKGWKDWDKLVSGLWAGVQYLLLPLVAALDQRFDWTGEIGIKLQGVGAAIYALSLALSGWAMISNAYFSTAARIQADRGQQVCRSGPYRFVRHPGYVGFVLQSPSIAILLGSVWALLPAIVASVLMIIRTILEDRMLQAELEGYTEYAQEVRYRLVPRVW